MGEQRTYGQLMGWPCSHPSTRRGIYHAVSAILLAFLLATVLGFLLCPFPLPPMISPSHGVEPNFHLQVLKKYDAFCISFTLYSSSTFFPTGSINFWQRYLNLPILFVIFIISVVFGLCVIQCYFILVFIFWYSKIGLLGKDSSSLT